jgi:hypothetical protein
MGQIALCSLKTLEHLLGQCLQEFLQCKFLWLLAGALAVKTAVAAVAAVA